MKYRAPGGLPFMFCEVRYECCFDIYSPVVSEATRALIAKQTHNLVLFLPAISTERIAQNLVLYFNLGHQLC